MKSTVTVLALAAALVAPAAVATPSKTLRVDRPSRAGAARVTTVTVLRGHLPTRPTRAVVLSDTRCDRDARGVSHCLNRMRLAHGGLVLARHDHRMSEMPCLDPGERVLVSPGR